MTSGYYTSDSSMAPAYISDNICNTPLPPITTVTEKLYCAGQNASKEEEKVGANQAEIAAMDSETLLAMDFSLSGQNFVSKICPVDLPIPKGYEESGDGVADLESDMYLPYSNSEKYVFSNVNTEFLPEGIDFYAMGYVEQHPQHLQQQQQQQLPHLLPQLELIPSSSHHLQPCVQPSWSPRVQQQLLQGEEENDEEESQEQQALLLQQQTMQLNQLLSQQLQQQHSLPMQPQMQPQFQQQTLPQHQQSRQLQQHFQQLQPTTEHLHLFQNQGLIYDASLPLATESIALSTVHKVVGCNNIDNVLPSEAYCNNDLDNFLLKSELSKPARLSGSVSSTTQLSFPTAQHSCTTSQQCCSTTALDLLATIRMESKSLRSNVGKGSLVENCVGRSTHMSPNHDLPTSTTDNCSGPSVAGKTGSGESQGHSKSRVADKEELNTKEIATGVNAELKKYSIPQAIFAERVLGRSQGTLSDLLRNPKPWSKLKSGRETFRRMRRWLDEPEHSRMVQLRVLSGDSTESGNNKLEPIGDTSTFKFLFSEADAVPTSTTILNINSTCSSHSVVVIFFVNIVDDFASRSTLLSTQ